MVLSYGGRAPALLVKICTRRPELTQQMQGWLKQRKGGATGVWGGPAGFCPANNFLLQYGFRSKRNNVSTNAENELKVVTFAFVVFDL